MANVTTDLDGSITIELSDGFKVRVPGLQRAGQVDAQEVRNVVGSLCELIGNLDNRLAALERRQAIEQMRRCEVARAT